MRFGKTLVIQEMDGVEPVLYPILRGDFISQGQAHILLTSACPFCACVFVSTIVLSGKKVRIILAFTQL